MSFVQLLYVSKSKQDLSEDDIHQILSKAHQHNRAAGITGILMVRGGVFLQLLEGEESAVESLYQKITSDPRHQHVTRIFLVRDGERVFPNWSMGFKRIEDLDLEVINEFMSWNRLIENAREIDQHLILHMLKRFSQDEAKKVARAV